jgi:cell division septation protein DedD
MAVLGLAVFGSAAAYGYRVMISAAPSDPTIIRADNSPTKITPMSDVKADSGRIGDRIGERLASRQEEPVDVGTSFRTAATDVAPAVPSDLRRVRTVPIPVDQGTASSPDRPPPASRAAAAPQALTQPAATPRQAAASSPVPSPQRQAAVAPAPPDTPAAAPVEGAGFVVQLLAVRNEADAQTEFRRFQTKYSSVLSGRQPLIRRKDRGEQGVYFVAQVGPFGAKSDADQLCDALKSAGGGCYVYKY